MRQHQGALCLWLMLVFLLAWGCSQKDPAPPIAEQVTGSTYRAMGRVLLVRGEERLSGEMELELDDQGRMHLMIRATWVNTLVTEIRITPTHMLILDYQNKFYFSGSNSSAARMEWLGMDIQVEEMRNLLFYADQAEALKQGRLAALEDPWKLEYDADNRVRRAIKPLGQDTIELKVLKYEQIQEKHLPVAFELSMRQSPNRLKFALTRVEFHPNPLALNLDVPEGFAPWQQAPLVN